jgi:hypothetical protein
MRLTYEEIVQGAADAIEEFHSDLTLAQCEEMVRQRPMVPICMNTDY